MRIELVRSGMAFPLMLRVRQRFESEAISDVSAEVGRQVAALQLESTIKSGASVAVGCSSRGISNYSTIVMATVRGLQDVGLKPFLFPAMGSHGAATADGQKRVLENCGLSEGVTGIPIWSSLETVEIGKTEDGISVLVDRHATEADHIVLVNRIKSHTEFTNEFESGLMKMMAIGMGKEKGATLYHKAFMIYGYPRIIRTVAQKIMDTGRLLFGVGIVEDGLSQTARINVLPSGSLLAGEKALLRESKRLEPRLPVEDVDVLVIDQMGKDISGSGFDAKVVGRINMPLVTEDPTTPRIKRIVVCDLTALSLGNADGVGSADFITQRLYDKIDLQALYVNALAGSEPEHARIPMTLLNDSAAISAGLNTIGLVPSERFRVMRIRNTRRLDELEVSEALIPELAGRDDLEVLGNPREIVFDASGNLAPFDALGP